LCSRLGGCVEQGDEPRSFRPRPISAQGRWRASKARSFVLEAPKLRKLGALPSPSGGGAWGGGRAPPLQVAPSLSRRIPPPPATSGCTCVRHRGFSDDGASPKDV